MIDLDITLVIQLINFLVTLVVLNFLLIRPIREIIKRRADNMAGLLSEAEKFAETAEGQMAQYQAALDEARAKATAEREALKATAQDEERKLLSDAGAAAQEQLGQARQELGGQVEAAMSALKAKVDDMAKLAADKVLG